MNSYFNDYLAGNNSLRKIIRLIKKWKQEKYKNSNNDNEIPPSIALTILACENFCEYDHLIEALYNTLNEIKNKFTIYTDFYGNITFASLNCNLPVEPYSDVFYKMRNSDSHMITFYKRISDAVNNLNTAISLEDEHEAGKYVQKVLGDSFEIPKKEVKNTEAKYNRESSFG